MMRQADITNDAPGKVPRKEACARRGPTLATALHHCTMMQPSPPSPTRPVEL